MDIFILLLYKEKNNLENILLNEGKNIISGHLDIFNMFEQLYKYEKNQGKIKRRENDIIEMSDICKFKLNTLNNKFIGFILYLM